VFISFLNALFSVQRFDVVVAMLRDWHAISNEFEIGIESSGLPLTCVRWEMSPSERSRFTFEPSVYQTDASRHEIVKFHWLIPLYAHYLQTAERETGSLVINQDDIGIVPGLAWSDNRPDRFLVPDCVFVPTKGYSFVRTVFDEHYVAWPDRRPIALWRGSTTGPLEAPKEWRSLARIKLCEIARNSAKDGLIDAGISAVVQFSDDEVVREIKQSGLMRDAVPWEEWIRYKYQIDIDGNTNAWSGFFQRLLTGSPVLKIESPRGLTQWFYDELRPWHNYVPVAPDMSDLVSKVNWLNRNDAVAEAIGRRGLELASRLSYAREMMRSVPVISAAFRYFSGRPCTAGPYGRPVSASSDSSAG
jgi:hypothetical protein